MSVETVGKSTVFVRDGLLVIEPTFSTPDVTAVSLANPIRRRWPMARAIDVPLTVSKLNFRFANFSEFSLASYRALPDRKWLQNEREATHCGRATHLATASNRYSGRFSPIQWVMAGADEQSRAFQRRSKAP